MTGWDNGAEACPDDNVAPESTTFLPGRCTRLFEAAGSRSTVIAGLASITGLYYLIVATTNCIDTDTNRRALAAVLSMRQTVHHPGVDWHAITSGTEIWVVYIVVVVWESLSAVVLLAAAVAWWRVVAGQRSVRDTAVRLASVGWTMVMLLFLGGFITIAGEWFRMWANTEVNATSAALQNFIIASVGLILLHLPAQPD